MNPVLSSQTSAAFNRVIQYSPPYFALPAKGYGGSERIVSGIAEYFTRNAGWLPFDTELWAPGNSYAGDSSPARPHVVPTVQEPFGLGRALEAEKQILADLHRLRKDVRRDFSAAVHFHLEDTHFPIFGADPLLASRTLTTAHNPIKEWQREEYKHMPLVAISHAQKRLLGVDGFDFVEVVHNGVNPDLYKPRYDLSETAPLAFLGRFSPDKNPAGAARIALASGFPIVMAGPVDPQYPDCLAEIRDLQSTHGTGKVNYIGSVTDDYDPSLGETRKSAFLGASRALLFPIKWKEPFGLVVIEANACGTPVIAYDHPGSSVSELIVDGVNGFKVRNEVQAADAVRQLASIDRRRVREHFERHFAADVMARRYAEIFTKKLPAYHASVSAEQRQSFRPLMSVV